MFTRYSSARLDAERIIRFVERNADWCLGLLGYTCLLRVGARKISSTSRGEKGKILTMRGVTATVIPVDDQKTFLDAYPRTGDFATV